MIRVYLTLGDHAYGYDVTNWETKSSDWYDNLLTEDLVERISEGDTLMYVDSNDSAERWCEDNEYDYELIEPNDDN